MIRLLVALFVNQFAIALRTHSVGQLRGKRTSSAASAVAEKKSPSLTPRDVANRLGISVQTVIRHYDSGALVGVDLTASAGRRRRLLRFDDEDVARFAAEAAR